MNKRVNATNRSPLNPSASMIDKTFTPEKTEVEKLKEALQGLRLENNTKPVPLDSFAPELNDIFKQLAIGFIFKQLAIEFISKNGNAKFEHEETVKFGGRVEVFGYVKPDRCYDYYIQTIAEIPTKCKFFNEITVSATCIAVEDGEDVFDCRIEELGLTKEQLASFINGVKFWSLDYK